MNLSRRTLQVLSRQRLREARTLYRAGLWPGAYYLAGYSVECALKACIAKQRRRHELPFSREDAVKFYTHRLDDLRTAAGLMTFDDPEVRASWTITKDWSESDRYREDITRSNTRDLIAAIAGRRGVLTWLRKHW